MVCNRCNKLNNDSAKFCRYCGNELIDEEYYEDYYEDEEYDTPSKSKGSRGSYFDEIDRLKNAASDGFARVADNMGDLKYIAMDGLDKAKDVAWNLKEAAESKMASARGTHNNGTGRANNAKRNNNGSSRIKIAVPLIAIAAVVILVLLLRGPTVNLNKYLDFELEGTNGDGYLYVSLDTDKLAKKLTGKVKLTAEGRQMMGSDYDKEDIAEEIAELYEYMIEVDKDYNLSNGDKVKYYWEEMDEFDRALLNGFYNVKCNIKYKDGVYTVKGLK